MTHFQTAYGPAIHQRAIIAGLRMRAELSPVDTSAPSHIQQEQARDAERGVEFRGISLPDLCAECLRIEGIDLGRVSRLNMVRSACSTASLSAVLTNVVGATIAAAYEATIDSTDGWVSEVFDKPNFQTAPALIVGAADKLERLERGETARHATIPGDAESYAVSRYAKVFNVCDEDLAEDNFGALVAVPRRLGEAAAELRPDLIYSILLGNETLNADSVALFHTDHSNLDTTSSVLNESNLQRGISKVGKQKDSSGADLNLAVTHLIVPVSLKLSAAKLLRSFMLDDSEQIVLRSDGRLDNSVVDPRDNTTHSANGSQWFLAAAAGAGGRTVEVGYLEGNSSPVVFEHMLTQGKWGLSFSVKQDIGAKALDFRGLYKAVGT